MKSQKLTSEITAIYKYELLNTLITRGKQIIINLSGFYLQQLAL